MSTTSRSEGTEAAAHVRNYKIRPSANGVEVTINGLTFELGTSVDAFLFDLQVASSGHEPKEATAAIARAEGR